MADKIFSLPGSLCKYLLRKTEEEVEVIDFEAKERGDRADEDWVTYIDSKGIEHIKEHLNIQLDFKPLADNAFEKILSLPALKNSPTVKNQRIFETAKELVKKGLTVNDAVSVATQLVNEIGIETFF